MRPHRVRFHFSDLTMQGLNALRGQWSNRRYDAAIARAIQIACMVSELILKGYRLHATAPDGTVLEVKLPPEESEDGECRGRVH